jgi:hypothetical protein
MYYHRAQVNPLLFLAGLVLGAIAAPIVKKKMSESNKWKNIKDSGQGIYEQMVDEVTDKYARAKGISKHELVDLADDLKMHWGRIKQAWNE